MENKKESETSFYFKKRAKYGRRFGNIFNLVKFNWFILKKLITIRNDYNVIHACDFDTILPSIFMRIFFKKHIIYDIFDWYIDSRGIKNFILKNIILFQEFINIKLSDAVIVCEQERVKQIKYTPKQLWILPNIPNFDYILPISKCNENLTISYVGILGEQRGLEKLINYAKEHKSLNLEIAGFGPLDFLLGDLKKYPNIVYYGSVKYQDALKIMNTSDIIYAIYEKTNPNHILAAPNKYYEGLFLGKPIITTKGTIVGDKTEKYNTGYT
ncbi:MAG: hypothetical protein VB122_08910, partial [Erysipelotrichales bacterium]|nr:hypothetical protein [Erysipelotrichales bacterium]